MLELGMSMSLEQLILDSEYNSMNRIAAKGVEISKKKLAIDAIEDIGAGRDFLGHMDTLEYMDDLSHTDLLNRDMLETWRAAGAKNIVEVAHERAVDIMKCRPQRTPLTSSERADIDKIIKRADKKVAQ